MRYAIGPTGAINFLLGDMENPPHKHQSNEKPRSFPSPLNRFHLDRPDRRITFIVVVSGFQANEKCDQMLGVRLCQAIVQLCDVYQPSEISHLQANEQQMHMLNK